MLRMYEGKVKEALTQLCMDGKQVLFTYDYADVKKGAINEVLKLPGARKHQGGVAFPDGGVAFFCPHRDKRAQRYSVDFEIYVQKNGEFNVVKGME